MVDNIDSDAKHFIVKKRMSEIDEVTKNKYVEELDDLYCYIEIRAFAFWDEYRLECFHCTDNPDLEEENIALDIERKDWDYYKKNLRENSRDYLERVFTDAEVVFDLFNKHNDYDGGEIIGWEIITDDLLAFQIHHAAFVASKKDLTNYQRELILSLMYSCVVEARKIVKENFPTLKSIFKI